MASFHFARRPVRTTVSFLKAACLVHLGITYGYTISPAQGPSMLPTFTVDGDWILCDHTRRYGRGVSVGDLVVYRIPIFNNQWGVKRVTGMPGDYVSVGTPGEQGEELMIQVLISILVASHTNFSDPRRALLDFRRQSSSIKRFTTFWPITTSSHLWHYNSQDITMERTSMDEKWTTKG